jgi:hypothetical protein
MKHYTHYTLELDERIHEDAIKALREFYYFDDLINTHLSSENTLEILNPDLLDEIEYFLQQSGFKWYTISLSSTIGI